ncbi:MAG: hypothetical protein F6K40_14540 [Okeania sp. SIO3I5]|uniref:hypothetical protein n=1 Tax=Okeania sp. SIO3I5 TaxID=2607805 RepID=UPI0013BB2259|nr:hypothetical protein [Okeania sp. SIO3I5]NEQ37416.1 hypothetical protein [Okeania sp. SIO3I5]
MTPIQPDLLEVNIIGQHLVRTRFLCFLALVMRGYNFSEILETGFVLMPIHTDICLEQTRLLITASPLFHSLVHQRPFFLILVVLT